MEKINDNEINLNLNFFKLMCAFLVIMIHVNVFYNESQILNFIFVQVFPRIAVPFFFMISGYFFKNGLLKRETKQDQEVYLKTKIMKLIKMYTLVSLLYFFIELLGSLDQVFNKDFLISYIFKFFIDGVYYHLWFFIALIYYTILYYKLEKYQMFLYCISIFCYIIGLFFHAYSFVVKDISIFKFIFSHVYLYDNFRRIITYGFPFYILGTQISAWKNKKYINGGLILSISLFFIEIFWLYGFSKSRSYTITIFLYPMCYFVFCNLLRNRKPIIRLRGANGGGVSTSYTYIFSASPCN